MEDYIQQIRDIFKKDGVSNHDCLVIYQFLKNTIIGEEILSGFEDDKRSQLLKLCSCFKYGIASKGNPMFTQGEQSNGKFYIVLSGKVAVFVNLDPFAKSVSKRGDNYIDESVIQNPIDFEQMGLIKKIFKTDIDSSIVTTRGQKLLNKKSQIPILKKHKNRLRPVNFKNNKQLMFLAGIKNENESTSNSYIAQSKLVKLFEDYYIKDKTSLTEDELNYYESKYGVLVRTMTFGAYFGERGIEESKTRTATCLPLTNCEYLMLDKEDYNEYIRRALKKKTNRVFDFFIRVFHCNHRSNDVKFFYTLTSSFKVC